MNTPLVQLLRFVHIVSASFWVGTAVTLGYFVYPTLLASEIAGARYLRQIMIERKLAALVILGMVIAILSGAWLYWVDFGSAMRGPMTRQMLDYSLGGFFGLVAAVTVLSVNAPTGMKLGAIVASVGTGSPTADQSNEIARLSRKLIIATKCVAVLVLGAAGLMALARYAL